jgi:hypothetical protein
MMIWIDYFRINSLFLPLDSPYLAVVESVFTGLVVPMICPVPWAGVWVESLVVSRLDFAGVATPPPELPDELEPDDVPDLLPQAVNIAQRDRMISTFFIRVV